MSVKVLEECNLRSSVCVLQLRLGVRVGILALERVQFLCLTLERLSFHSSGIVVYQMAAG